ncbi:TetR/AcrR family transcriptional regulator, partial [Pseudomonas paraeruginosa]|nr:TetR/AcrR family transcriptional regulator [Pseudomonas paraeruginosa]
EVDALAVVLRGPGAPAWRLAAGLRRFAARAWSSPRLAVALIAEPVDPEVDEQRLRYREADAALFVELLEEGRRSGAFRLSLVP